MKQHNPYSSEILVMAVASQYHRRGIGRALVTSAKEDLLRRGAEYMQVKTLGPSRLDEGYAKTRRFYEAMGYRPLEEFPTLWDAANPSLLMVKRL